MVAGIQKRHTHSAALWAAAVLMVSAALSLQAGVMPTGAEEANPQVTVVIELVVQDAKGRPVADLELRETEVIQDATRQHVATFKPCEQPGHYELSYAPASGKAGAVTVRVLRRGTQVSGPEGSFLRPRVVRAQSPLEVQLTSILEARPQADDLDCSVSVLHFESGPKGIRHAFAVEVALSELRLKQEQGRYRDRLQILARVQSEDGRFRQHLTLDRPVDVGSEQGLLGRPLVWTGSIPLAPGRYKVETLVRESTTERATVRTLAFDVPPVSGGLRMSSVTLLQPRSFFFVRDEGEDDPFVYHGTPLMPTLRLVLPLGADVGVRFFVVLYPDPKNPEPVSLGLQLHRRGDLVGEAPIALPPPEPSGEIRYVGLMPTKTFRAAPYVLRFVARQGQALFTDEASFVISPSPEKPPVRFFEDD
jgi:hypothetical protein